MVIRGEQIAVLENKALDDFVTSLKDYQRRSHGTVRVRVPIGVHLLQGMPDRILTELAWRSIAKGELYSLTCQSSLAAFVRLMFVAAPNFDADTFIRRNLTDPALLSNDLVDRVCQSAKHADWKRMRKAYDPEAWAALPAASRS